MTGLRWIFMSKYKKLLYAIEICRRNGQRLHIDDANLILDFEDNKMEEINILEYE